MWWTSHGDGTLGCNNTGDRQYQGSDTMTKNLWNWFTKVAGDKLVDVSQMPPNATSFSDIWRAKKQILAYTGGYCELSGKGPSSKANPFDGSGTKFALPDKGKCGWGCDHRRSAKEWQGKDAKEFDLNEMKDCFHSIANCGVADNFVGKFGALKKKLGELDAKDRRAAYKARNVFYMNQAVSSAKFEIIFDNMVIEAGTLSWWNLIEKQALQQIAEFSATKGKANTLDPEGECRNFFGPPVGTHLRCPKTLLDIVSLSNYWLQWPMWAAFNKGYTLPNAVYIDGLVNSHGWGAADIGANAHGLQTFPYVKWVLGFNIVSLCGKDQAKWSASCKKMAGMVGEKMIPDGKNKGKRIVGDVHPCTSTEVCT